MKQSVGQVICYLFLAALLLLCLEACHGESFDVEGDYSVKIKSPFKLVAPGTWDIVIWSHTPGVVLVTSGASAEVTAQSGAHTISAQAVQVIWEERRLKQSTFRITLAVVAGDDDDAPVPDPADPPPIDVSRIERISREKASALNDSATAKRLLEVITKQLALQRPLEEMRLAVRAAISDVLLTRQGPSRNKDWLGWRKAVDSELAGKTTTVAAYIAGLKAIGRGLRGAITLATIKHVPSPNRAAEVRLPRAVSPPRGAVYSSPVYWQT